MQIFIIILLAVLSAAYLVWRVRKHADGRGECDCPQCSVSGCADRDRPSGPVAGKK